MHASAKVLAVFLALVSGCAAAPEANPAAAGATPQPAEAAPTAKPSALPALERVLEVLAVPKVDAAGCELTRLDARGDEAGVRIVLDVDVTGPDEVTVNVTLERLLDSLRDLEGARGVEVQRSRSEGATRARLEGVSIEFAGEPARPRNGCDGADWMSSLRNLASDPSTRLGGVEIERRGDDDESLRVSAFAPGNGQRLDRLRSYMAAIESRIPGANVVRVSLKPGGSAAEPPLYHWQIEIGRDA